MTTRLDDLALLRRMRDRMDREYTQPIRDCAVRDPEGNLLRLQQVR